MKEGEKNAGCREVCQGSREKMNSGRDGFLCRGIERGQRNLISISISHNIIHQLPSVISLELLIIHGGIIEMYYLLQKVHYLLCYELRVSVKAERVCAFECLLYVRALYLWV